MLRVVAGGIAMVIGSTGGVVLVPGGDYGGRWCDGDSGGGGGSGSGGGWGREGCWGGLAIYVGQRKHLPTLYYESYKRGVCGVGGRGGGEVTILVIVTSSVTILTV